MNKYNRMDHLLQRYRLGELPPHLKQTALEMLSTPQGKRRMEELEAEDEKILLEFPPEKVASEISRRLDEEIRAKPAHRERSTTGWLLGAGLALASIAVVATVLMPAHPPKSKIVSSVVPTATDSLPAPGRKALPQRTATAPETQLAQGPTPVVLPGDDGTRTKGYVRRLRIHRVDASGGPAIAVVDGDSAHFGDLLQVSLLTGPATFAAVLSLDGTGRVTRHIPETGDSSIRLRKELEAPHSFQLDAAPGFERFVLIQSDHPFPLREAEALLRRAGADANVPVPRGWTAQSIHIAKSEIRP